MTKKRLIPAAIIIAFAALLITLNWSTVVRAQTSALSFTFGQSNPLNFMGGVTASAAKALPVKLNADGDGVTGHLVVDCSTGCSGGGGGNTFPFNAAAGGQTATTASFVGIAGFNGTTVDPLLSINGGQLKVTNADQFGNTALIEGFATDAIPQKNAYDVNTFPLAFNGTTWDRLRSVNTGQLKTTLYDLFGNTLQFGQTGNTDGNSSLLVTSPASTFLMGFNGTSWDRLRATAPGVAGTTAGILAVQGVTGGIALPISGTVAANGPLTGLNSTGTVGAVAQAFVQDCNFTTSPATVTTGNVVPVSCNNKAQQIQDVQSVAGAAITTATGIAGQHIYPANTSGGGCAGINLSTGTQIARVNLAPVTITASEAATQIVAAVASKFVHICSLTISGTTSTGGAINILTGTGTNCGTGTATLWTLNTGTNAAGFIFDKGNGEQSFLDSITAGEICVSSGAFVATAGPTLVIAYSQN